MATKKITDLTQLTDLDATDSFVVNDSGAGADKRVEFSDLQSEVLNGAAIGTSTAITELQVDNLNLNGNTISSTDTNGNIIIEANGTGDVIVNEGGGDSDFRVEGSTDTNLLFVDADTNRVGIGTSSPDYKLRMNFTVPTSAENGIKLNDGTRSALYAFTGDTYSYRGVGANTLLAYSGGDIAFLTDKVSNSKITFHNTNNEVMRIDSSGNVGIGVTPSAWNTAGDTKALQISTVTAVGEAYDTAFISANWYLASGPLEKYIGNGIASRMTLSSDPNGKNISLSTAPNNTSGAGASLTWKERFGMNLTEAVINDTSEDYDFRVEGATDTHLIFADAGNDRVGIGTSSPTKLFHVDGTAHIPLLNGSANVNVNENAAVTITYTLSSFTTGVMHVMYTTTSGAAWGQLYTSVYFGKNTGNAGVATLNAGDTTDAGSGNLSITASGSDIVISKTAGSGGAAGTLTISIVSNRDISQPVIS